MKHIKSFNESVFENLEEYKKGRPESFGYKIGRNIENPNEILQDITFIQGYLSLNGSKITELPNGLEVDGYLSLSNTKIRLLPNGLVVNGDLDLLNCTKLIDIPGDLVVRGNLVLNGRRFEKDELTKRLPFVSNIIIM